MKYQIGEQVINRNSGDLEIIESRELISDIVLYYTVSGKSFAENQLGRYWKTVEDAEEIMDSVVKHFNTKLEIVGDDFSCPKRMLKRLKEIEQKYKK